MGSFITSSILSYVFILSSYPTSIFVSFQGFIRAPTQGATISGKRAASGHHSFNPRSHAGSDPAFHHLLLIVLKVSIHAPTQGATLQTRAEQLTARVSIHAPTQGATSLR